jgi:hypothetical protein
MTFFRTVLIGLGIVLLLGAIVVGFVHIAEPIPGERCMAVRLTPSGQTVPACPDTAYVRHVGIAIGMAIVGVVLIASGALGRPRS